ncbi:MAG TPA: o-succinylbenzoate--CoA ligase [Gemmatimonadales bacterium]
MVLNIAGHARPRKRRRAGGAAQEVSCCMLLWLPWRAAVTPDRLALVAPDGARLSYAGLHARADDVASRLAGLGMRAGDRVAVMLPNGAEIAAVAHAAMRTGAVLLPLNLRLTTAEQAWQVTDAGARLLVFASSTAHAAAEVRERAPGLELVSVDGDVAHDFTPLADVVPAENTALRYRARPDEPLAILYTSGTTGSPKGAILTYANFWWSAIGSALNLGVHEDDRWLAPMPLFHVGGLSVLTRSAIQGTAAIVHDGFDAEHVSDAIDEERVTLVSLVPTMLGRLLDARGGRPFPSSLRCVLLGGGPAPRPLLERCAALGVPVSQTYGLTEACSQVATLAPADALRRLGSAGRPLYPTELRVARDDGADAAAGEAGEILVRGPTVTPGYWNRPDATARALRDGWLHTGDAGMLDDEGYLYVLDRRDDLVVSGGENVYPAEVEGALLAHPEVVEAAVVGVPDDEWGQRVAALVRVTGDAVTPDALRAFCRERIARYKVPAELRITRDALPRNAAGKLLRREVRREFEVRWGADAQSEVEGRKSGDPGV